MQQAITLDDVLASDQKYGGAVLTYNIKKVRDLKTINPKNKFDTTYIPLEFRHVNGKEMPVKIKFSEQLIGSSAKAPQGSDTEGIPKHLNISFMKMARDAIEGGDYTPKVKTTEKLQEVENTRMKENIDRYIENNEKFIKVLNIIDKAYKLLCADIISKDSTFSFRIKKDRNQKDVNVFSIKQETRLNKDTNADERLENPIFRLKVPVCKKDGRVGVWSNFNDKFQPTVFDARKMNSKNKYAAVPATVKVNNVLKDLDVSNANSFIVYKSLVGGHIVFECIVASKFGLSMNNSFYDLYVYRHKSKLMTATISKDDIIKMRGGESEEEEEDVEEVNNTNEEETKETNENDEENDEENDVEPNDSDDDKPEPVISTTTPVVVIPDKEPEPVVKITEEPTASKKIAPAKKGKKVTKN